MFIAMNRFRVKKGSEHAFERVWLGRDTYLDCVPVSWNFISSRGRRRQTIRSIPRTACGRASGPSRRGPSRKNFGPRTRVPATRQLGRFIWSILNLRASKYARPSPLERWRPREPQMISFALRGQIISAALRWPVRYLSEAQIISGARRHGRAYSPRRRLSHRQNKCRRDEAERTGDEEGREISRIFRTYQTGAERRTGSTDLVAGEHPPEHHAGLLRAKRSAVSLTVGGTVAIQSRP